MRPLILLVLVLLASAAHAAPARFVVADQMAADEIGENTDIYLDNRLLAHVHLDTAHPSVAIDATSDDGGAPHPYALCGDITVRGAAGAPETHDVNATGLITDLDGRRFQALGTANFTFFYLADPTPGRVPTAPGRGRSPLCHPPVS